MLEGYFFVPVTAASSMFEMLEKVQPATKKWLDSQGQLERWKEQYMDHLHAMLPAGRFEDCEACKVFFPHAKAAVAQKPKERGALTAWNAGNAMVNIKNRRIRRSNDFESARLKPRRCFQSGGGTCQR